MHRWVRPEQIKSNRVLLLRRGILLVWTLARAWNKAVVDEVVLVQEGAKERD
ncbi:hypothetical protein C0992_006762, partial [Termitomyces sp. T32_za158]